MVKKFYPVTRHRKVYVYPHNFSVSRFSSSDIHQSHHLDGCQAMGISHFLICAFWALRFIAFIPIDKLIIIAHDYHRYHAIFVFVDVTNQSGTYFNNHRYFLTAFSHISQVLKRSGTYVKKHGSMYTSLALMRIKYIHGRGLRR